MLLDKYLSFDYKILLSMIVGSIWIYYRKYQNYKLLERKSLRSVILVSIWIYIHYYEPLFLPIGICIIYLYSKYHK